MNEFKLTTFLTSNTDIDANFIEELVQNCQRKTVVKGEFLLQQGETCKQTFFVEKGLLRYYAIDGKGKEHILQFAPEGWLLSDRASLFFNQASSYFIQALEDSELLLLDPDFFAHLAKKDASFFEFNNKLLHNHIKQLQHRILLLLSATAEDRYLDFIKIYPDILLRVPQLMVASYLGITPESLSRVRKELAASGGNI